MALFNGLIWGGVIGIVAALLYDSPMLGVVMTAAMTLNLLLAAFMGVGIPMMMIRLGRDPALGSSVFLTFMTDSGGFFIFLGLATHFPGLGQATLSGRQCRPVERHVRFRTSHCLRHAAADRAFAHHAGGFPGRGDPRLRRRRRGRTCLAVGGEARREHRLGGARTGEICRCVAGGGWLCRHEGSPCGHPADVFGAAGRQAGPDWSTFPHAEVRVLAATRHSRKLKRGALRGNRFVLVLREVTGRSCAAEQVLQQIAARGVPNYFGEQRFGREGGNVAQARAMFAGRRVERDKRSFLLSAARSQIFNEVLAARVERGSWDTALEGEIWSLAGSRSWFGPEPFSDVLAERLARGDIHPSGPCGDRASRQRRARPVRWSARSLQQTAIWSLGWCWPGWIRSGARCG